MPPEKTEKSSARMEPYAKTLKRERTWSDNLKEMAPSINPSLRREKLLADLEKSVEFQQIDIHSDDRGLFVFGVMQSGETICVQVTGFEGLAGDQLDLPSRFMVDKTMVALSWIEIPAQSFTNVVEAERKSTCQYELVVGHTSVKKHARKDWAHMAPLRILSFDIETMVPEDNTFPNPNTEADSVIQIATMVSIVGNNDFLNPATRVVFTIGECNQADLNAELRVFENEHELIQAWFDLVAVLDADIITGYNVLNFDIPFLICRMNRVGEMRDLPGRISSLATPVSGYHTRDMSGPRPTPPPPFIGRPVLDMYRYMIMTERFLPTSWKTLNTAAKTFLNMSKEDVSFKEISALQRGSDEDRTKLALYCLKDTLIPLGLIGHFDVLSASSPFVLRYQPLHLLFPLEPKFWIDAKNIYRYRRPS